MSRAIGYIQVKTRLGRGEMMGIYGKKELCAGLIFLLLSGLSPLVLAEEEERKFAFPEKFSFRLAGYSVERADTTVSVARNDTIGLGAGISFSQDLGGDDTAEIPRVDMYYRFNERHRIEFSHFSIDRAGRRILSLEIDVEDLNFSVGETVISEINYDVTRLGYGYSFYHSESVELAISAGLNFTGYEFDITNSDGSSRNQSDVSAPLPMFGLRLGYAINERWSIHYLSETFFIEIEDEIRGSLLNYELNVQYRFPKHVIVGLGMTRVGAELEANDSDWRGRISDTHRGYLLFVSYYI